MLKLRTQWARRSALFVTGVAASAAMLIALSATPASAATIDYEHPGSSCVGDHDVLHWEPQSVPGLLGYQVEQWVDRSDIPTKYLVTQVGPTVTSLPFVVQTADAIGNSFFVKTITESGVSGPFDGAGVLSQVPPFGAALQFIPTASVGNHQATVVFARSPMDKFTDFATSVAISPSPPGGRATILDGIGFTTRFDHLRNGTPYRFTAVGTNACGTGDASAASYLSVVPGLIHITTPAALSPGAVGMPYLERLKATGGCTDKALCGSVRVQWGVTSGTTPPGMRLLGPGQLEGVPTTAGSFTFTVTASAACGCISDHPTKTFTIQVGPAAPAIASSATVPVVNGSVTFKTNAPAMGTHPMTAVFNGSSDEQSSSTAAIDVVIV